MARTPGLKFDLSDIGDSRKLRRVLNAVTSCGKVSVEVGLFEGTTQFGSEDAAVQGANPATYMFMQEFGYGGVPESPWFRSVLTKGAPDFGRMLGEHAGRIVAEQMTPEESMFRLGNEVRNRLIQSIVDFGLIDTNTARLSVSFQVVAGTVFAGGLLGRAELGS